MLAETSRTARRAAEDSGAITAGCRRIMVWFHGQPAGTDATRAEIARATGIPLQTVCARIRDILDDPRPFLEELKARPCAVTGNSSHPLRIAPPKAAGQVPPKATRGRATDEADSPEFGRVESATHVRETPRATPAPAVSEWLVHDADGKPFYTAVGPGPGWPPDQDHLHRRRAA